MPREGKDLGLGYRPLGFPIPARTPRLYGEDDSEFGSVRISENVIAAIVRKYVLEAAGVVRFATGGTISGLAEMIGKQTTESSITVELESETVRISVHLILRFGSHIPDVAASVQEIVRTRVEEATGKRVTRVDVLVQDLEEVPPAEWETTSQSGNAAAQ